MTERLLLLAGGGTLGPVTPLLAVVEASQRNRLPYRFHWVGTRNGPEEVLVRALGIPFSTVVTSKYRRYWSFKNLVSPLALLIAFLQALVVLRRARPHAVLSAGGFVSVPVAFAAWLWRIPIVLHEQDRQDGLAVRLLRPLATLRTSVWPRVGAETIGNLVRPSVKFGQAMSAASRWAIDDTKPLMLALGGGTGARNLNQLIVEALEKLTREGTVFHVTGRGKATEQGRRERYVPVAFVVSGLGDLYALADVVISRAGMGTLSELAAAGKATVVVPLPGTHQEENARYLAEQSAVRVVEESAGASLLARTILELLFDPEEQRRLGQRFRQAIPDGLTIFLSHLSRILVAK